MPGINKIEDEIESLMVYREEDVNALNIVGKNVYNLEK